MIDASEIEAHQALARLFGTLLLHELDLEMLVELREPEVVSSLSSLGITVPEASTRDEIDRLAAEFHELILRPQTGAPLVQSLWTSGSYQGDPAVTLKKLADVASLEFDADEARGAEPDHLGVILLLWAETRGFAPEVADRIEADHIGWAVTPLGALGRDPGFYGQLGRALQAWLGLLVKS